MPRKRRRSLRRLLGRGVLGALALAALITVGLYLFTVRLDRRSVPYRQAMERLRQNRSATRLLGVPVEAGWWVRGHARADSARLAVPIEGNARVGVLHVEAQKAGSAWVFSRLELVLGEAGLRVSLLESERSRRDVRQEGSAPLDVPSRYRE